MITSVAFLHEKRKSRVNVLHERIDSIIDDIAKICEISKSIFKKINQKFDNTQKL